MFENLSERLTAAVRSIAGRDRLTEANIAEAVREVRVALLEADVGLSVVRTFIDGVRERAIGQQVDASLNAGQAFVQVVRDELVRLMGEANDALNLATNPPAVVLLAGLQGAGKTATAAKLARHLKERERKRVAVVSADVYRPAAIDQLRLLGDEAGARFIPSTTAEKPVAIAKRALADARTQFDDVLIVDTAGRLHTRHNLMDELRKVRRVINSLDAAAPHQVILTLDATTGHNGLAQAQAFTDAVGCTGIFLAKLDGTARGGIVLAIRRQLGVPILFIGTGENLNDIAPFDAREFVDALLQPAAAA